MTDDRFFTQSRCDRCGGSLEHGRTMSWFTADCICMACASEERALRDRLPRKGADWEGCGYVPKLIEEGDDE